MLGIAAWAAMIAGDHPRSIALARQARAPVPGRPRAPVPDRRSDPGHVAVQPRRGGRQLPGAAGRLRSRRAPVRVRRPGVRLLRRGRAGLDRRVRPGARAAGPGDRAGPGQLGARRARASRCTPRPTSTPAPAAWSPRTPRRTRRWPSRRPPATICGATSRSAAWPTSRACRAGRRTAAGTPTRPLTLARSMDIDHSGPGSGGAGRCSSSGSATRTRRSCTWSR